MDVAPDTLVRTMERLKTYPDLGFTMLLDITAVD
jgi:hypothetical protein